MSTDRDVTTSRQEAELWRSTMQHFYGDGWQVDLAVEEAHAVDRQGAAALCLRTQDETHRPESLLVGSSPSTSSHST